MDIEDYFDKHLTIDFDRVTDHFRKRLIEAALDQNGGHVTLAAEWLNINRTTLHEMIKKHKIPATALKMRPPPRYHVDRNISVVRNRRCNLCFTGFVGNHRKACPECGNNKPDQISIVYDRTVINSD